MQSVVVRPYAPGDEEAIEALLGGTMEWPGFDHRGEVMDFWRWRYHRNPLGTASESMALDEAVVLSHAASLPTEVRIGDSVIFSAQLSDLYTREEHRGRKLVERAVAEVERLDRDKGVRMQFAFPSPAGYELLKKYGFREMPVRMAQYELIVNPQRFFSQVKHGVLKRAAYESMRMVKGKARTDIPDVVVERADRLPADLGPLVARFEEGFSFVLHRSDDYLKWRYLDADGGTFELYTARRGAATCGYIVLRPYNVGGQRFMDIVDLVALPGDLGAVRAMVATAANICRETDVDVLQMWLPTDHPFVLELGRLGFFLRQPVPGERLMRILCRPLDDPAVSAALDAPHSYHLVLGDTDWI
jgi:hypothetical protein